MANIVTQRFVEPRGEDDLLDEIVALLGDPTLKDPERTPEKRLEWLMNAALLVERMNLKARIAKQTPAIICESVSYVLNNGVSVQVVNEVLLQKPHCIHEDVNNNKFLVTYSSNIEGGLTVFSLDEIPEGTLLGPYVSPASGTQVWGESNLSIFMTLVPALKDYPMQHNHGKPTVKTYRSLHGALNRTSPFHSANDQFYLRKFWAKHRNNPDLLLALNKYSLRKDSTGISLKDFLLPALRNCEGWDQQWEASLDVSYLENFFDCFSIPISSQTDTPYKKDGVMDRLSGYICRVNQASGVKDIVQTGQCNVDFCLDPGYSGPCVKTNRPVKKHDEILADYGPEYWKNKRDEAITRDDLLSLVKGRKEGEVTKMLEFTKFVQEETNFSGLVDRNVEKHLVTLLEGYLKKDPKILGELEDTDSEEEDVVVEEEEQIAAPKKETSSEVGHTLDVGDIVCIWNKTPRTNACKWNGIVISVNKTWIKVFWVGAIYAGEFKQFYGTVNSGSFRKKTFLQKRISCDVDERNIKNGEWYYLREEYNHLPKKIGEEEMAAMRKLVQVKKDKLEVTMNLMAMSEHERDEYVHALLKKEGADIVSIMETVCGKENPKQEEEMPTDVATDASTGALSSIEPFIMEAMDSFNTDPVPPLLKKRKRNHGSEEKEAKKVRFSEKDQIKCFYVEKPLTSLVYHTTNFWIKNTSEFIDAVFERIVSRGNRLDIHEMRHVVLIVAKKMLADNLFYNREQYWIQMFSRVMGVNLQEVVPIYLQKGDICHVNIGRAFGTQWHPGMGRFRHFLEELRATVPWVARNSEWRRKKKAMIECVTC